MGIGLYLWLVKGYNILVLGCLCSWLFWYLGKYFLFVAKRLVLLIGSCEAAHGSKMIDRLATHKVLSIVAGQLEVGYIFGHIT